MKRKSTIASDRDSVCLLDHYEISPEDLAAHQAQDVKQGRAIRLGRNRPTTPDQEERWIMEGRTWPDWNLPKEVSSKVCMEGMLQ